MTNPLIWTLAAFSLLGLGWLASSRFHRPRIEALQLQLKVLRETAAVHAQQARHQIAQLNAELATRPAGPRPPPPPHAEGTGDNDSGANTTQRRRADSPDQFLRDEHGFPHTAMVGDGFAPTQISPRSRS